MIMFSSSNVKYPFMNYICIYWFSSDRVPYFLIIVAYKTNSANLYKYVQLLDHP